jgi:hypothetical protein
MEVCAWAVPILVIVTVALGTAAPEESFTVPVSAPVVDVWLYVAGTDTIKQKTIATHAATKVRPRQSFETFNMNISLCVGLILNST